MKTAQFIRFSCVIAAIAMLVRPAGAEPSAKQAYEFAAKTLKYVEASAKRPELAAKLDVLKSRLDKTPVSEFVKLRREIILSHPALAFDSLLINKRPISGVRNHMVDHYLGRFSRPGDGLVILKNWKTEPKQTFVTKDRLPTGTITHPDLSFDAKKAVFAFCDHRRKDTRRRAFHLYEIALDSTGLRQLTGDSRDPMKGRLGRMTQIIEDFDPCYLPDGGIAFSSTRTMASVRCANYARYNPAFVLHRCAGDGSKIRALSFGELNEYDPALRADGRLVYTRWEYINRNITTVHGLWTTSPDGTAVEHFYGNGTIDPNVVVEARAIPGSRKVVASAVAHHRYFCGTVIVIDPEVADDGLKPLTRVTPEVAFPERRAHSYMGKPRIPDENGIYPYGLPYNLDDKTLSAAPPHEPKKGIGPYAMPFPLTEDLFLVAAMEKKTRKFAIYLIDTLGGRELIFRDPDNRSSCWAPIPIRPRKKPPVRASLVSPDPNVKDGAFFIQDVYQNRFDSTGVIKRGSVKGVRIIQLLDQPAERAIPRGRVLFELPKRILGTVPVDANGSVAFRAPAGIPMQLQLIDKNAMAVMTMRSFVYLHPGETASCVGCHEPKTTAPPPTLRGKAKIHDIVPPPWRTYEKGMSYSRTIQPVFDRYCIRCHGLDKKNPMSLIAAPLTKTYKQTGISTDWPGKITVRATEGYHNLLARPGAVAIAQAYNENLTSKPKDYFAHAGKLAGMLLAGHPDKKGKSKVQLDPASLRRIIDWLDLNAPFAGVYSFNRPENRTIDPAGEKALREHIKSTFGPKTAAQPIAALINVAEPDASRILLAPLARSAGGWEQLTPKWKSADAMGYRAMKKLVYAAIVFEKYKDIAGTCGRGSKNNCLCKACWIREAATANGVNR